MHQTHTRPAPMPDTTPNTMRWVASLLYLGVLCAGVYYHVAGLCAQPAETGRLGLFVGVLALLLVLERFGQRHTTHAATYLAVALLLVRMALFEVVAWADCSGFSRTLYLLVPFIAYFCLGRRVSYALALLYMAAFIARLWFFIPAWYLNRDAIADVLMFFIGLVFALSMAGVASAAEANRARAEQLLGDLEASHQQLKVYAQQAAELATAEERNRLARDIHDSLGHYLTVINVLLEKAIAYRQRNPMEAEQAVWDAKRSARQALQDVRQSVGALRHAEELFSLSAALAELVQTMRNRRLAIDFQLAGEEAGFPKLALMALYRAAQEGFTNIQKHAQARRVTLRVTLGEREASLSLRDDGRGFDLAVLDDLPFNRADRFGLQGLRERLELVGGTMSVESDPSQGTHLSIVIPNKPLKREHVAASSGSVA